MPRKPDGDVAMTSTERVHRFRERQRAAQGIGPTDRQKLNEALREIERLTALAAKAHEPPAKAAPDPIKGEEHFSAKSKQTIADAVRVHKAKLDKNFEQTVNDEVRRRIDTADDHVRNDLKKYRQRALQLEIELGKKGVFTEQQFKQMLKLCHPDDPASPATRTALLQVLLKNKLRLIKA